MSVKMKISIQKIKKSILSCDTQQPTLQDTKKCRNKKLKFVGCHFCKRVPGMMLNQFYGFMKRPLVQRLSFVILIALPFSYLIYTLLLGKFFWLSKSSKRITSGPFSGYRDCHPLEKFGFLKTENVASEIIQNSLIRYGLDRELNFLIPSSIPYPRSSGEFERSKINESLPAMTALKIDIFCQRAQWNHTEVTEVLGQESFFISVVADPIKSFSDFWNKKEMDRHLNTSLETFIINANDYSFHDFIRKFGFQENQMLWSFGLNLNFFTDKQIVLEKINEIENSFDLILVSEMLSESMLILREELCWNYRDILSLKETKNQKLNLSDEAMNKLRSWLWAEFMLFNHFLEKFQSMIFKYGMKKMEKDLDISKSANRHLRNICESQRKNGSTNDPTNSMCHYLDLSEASLYEKIQERQTKRFSNLSLTENSNQTSNKST